MIKVHKRTSTLQWLLFHIYRIVHYFIPMLQNLPCMNTGKPGRRFARIDQRLNHFTRLNDIEYLWRTYPSDIAISCHS